MGIVLRTLEVVSQLSFRNGDRVSASEAIGYLLTFGLILLTLAHRNDRQIVYAFEVFYIVFFIGKALRERSKISPYALWSSLFFGICLVSSLYSFDVSLALKQVFNILRILLIGNCIVFFIDGKRIKITFILYSYIIGAAYTSIILLARTPRYLWGTSRLGNTVGINANELGLQMAIACLIALYFLKERRKGIFLLLSLGFGTVALLSGSRKALFFIVIGVAVLFTFGLKKKRFLLIAFPIVLIFLFFLWNIVMTVPAIYKVLGQRVESMIDGVIAQEKTDASTSARQWMILFGMELFRDKPLLGYGVHSFTAFVGTYAHNNFVEILVGVGLSGFLVYYSLYFFSAIGLIKSITTESLSGLMFSLLLAIVIMEYGLVTYYVETYVILLVCAFSVASLSSAKHNRTKIMSKYT